MIAKGETTKEPTLFLHYAFRSLMACNAALFWPHIKARWNIAVTRLTHRQMLIWTGPVGNYSALWTSPWNHGRESRTDFKKANSCVAKTKTVYYYTKVIHVPLQLICTTNGTVLFCCVNGDHDGNIGTGCSNNCVDLCRIIQFYAQNNSSVLEECRNCTGIKGEKVDAKRQHRFLILASFAYDVGYGWTTRWSWTSGLTSKRINFTKAHV